MLPTGYKYLMKIYHTQIPKFPKQGRPKRKNLNKQTLNFLGILVLIKNEKVFNQNQS